MEVTLACSPEVKTSMSDRINVAEYHALYINFQKLVKVIYKKEDCSIWIQPRRIKLGCG